MKHLLDVTRPRMVEPGIRARDGSQRQPVVHIGPEPDLNATNRRRAVLNLPGDTDVRPPWVRPVQHERAIYDHRHWRRWRSRRGPLPAPLLRPHRPPRAHSAANALTRTAQMKWLRHDDLRKCAVHDSRPAQTSYPRQEPQGQAQAWRPPASQLATADAAPAE